MPLPATTLAFCLLIHVGAAHAARVVDPPPDPRVLGSEGFLGAHPDLRWRQLGLAAYERGDFATAFDNFKRASRFADKPSQGMVAEMLWRGEGVAQDRPLAYAWMDLAAERAYLTMLRQREKFWDQLAPTERERALEVGRAVYAELGDAVAQPRLERKLRSAKRQITGSRTGFVGNLKIVLSTLGGPVTIDGSDYYHRDYWEPERYWRWQEKGWKSPPQGQVDVGPLTSPSPPTGQPDSK